MKDLNYKKLTYTPKYEKILAIEYTGYNYDEILQFAGSEASKDNWDEPNYVRDDYRKIYFSHAGMRYFVKFRISDFIMRSENFLISMSKENLNFLFE